MGARSSTQQPVRSLDSFLYASKNKSRQEVLDERDDGSNLMFSPPKIHRGLQNFGENNCFLNVTVQALWHLNPFRSELLRLISNYVPGKSLYDDDIDNMNGMDVTEEDLDPSPPPTYSSVVDALCNLFTKYQLSDKSVLPPTELRMTLSTISDSFQLGEIADANEALDVILNKIHEESISCCNNEQTHCLAHVVLGGLLLEQTFCPCCFATSEPVLYKNSFIHQVNAAELIQHARIYASHGRQAPFGYLIRKSSGVGRKECPSVDDEPKPNPLCQSKGNVRLYCLEPPLALAIAIGWSSQNETVEQLKNFYSLISKSIQLNELFRSPQSHSHASDGNNSNSNNNNNASAGAGTTDDLSTSASVSKLKTGSVKYLFRGMICYYGLHYVSIFQEYGSGRSNFLLFDDHTVRSIGSWEQAVDLSLRAKYQPVCLLYELMTNDGDVGDSHQQQAKADEKGTHINRTGNKKENDKAQYQHEDSLSMDDSSKSSQNCADAKAFSANTYPLEDSFIKYEELTPTPVPTREPETIVYGSCPLIYEVQLVSTAKGVYGFQPVINDDGSVLISMLFRDPDTDEIWPAEKAGINLLDEIVTVDGVRCLCQQPEDITKFFRPAQVIMRLKSSFKRNLTFFCDSCKKQTSITSTDIDIIKSQYEISQKSSLVCSICDKLHMIYSLDELLHAAHVNMME
jgi:hypothetical protein